MDKHQMILDHMHLAKMIAWKFAKRQNVHQDEAVAEAYFRLTELFLVNVHMYLASPSIRTIGIYVKSKMINYFERRVRRYDPIVEDKIDQNSDEEMIEFLSGLFKDDDKAFAVFKLLRDGLTFEEIVVVVPELRKIAKRLKQQVSSRIQRLEEMQARGVKTTREIKYDRSLEAERQANEDYESGSGDSERGVDPDDAIPKLNQPESPSALAF